MENRILVLGSTGNIGTHVVRELQNRGADFVAGINSKSIEGVATVNIDFGNKESLQNAMHMIDTLFMLLPAHPQMVEWAQNVVEAARESGVKHIVRSSSAIAYDAPEYNFMRQLRKIDEIVMQSGLDYTILLPQFFMQNLSTMLAEDYKNGALYLPAGDEKVGWVDTRDIALVAAEVLLNPKEYNKKTITISSDDSLSYREVVDLMNGVLDKNTDYIAISSEVASEAMKEQGIPRYFIDLLIDLNGSIAKGLAKRVSDDFKTITGRDPISFSQFVNDYKKSWIE